MRFTKQSVPHLKLTSGKSERIIFDETLPGFGLRIRAGGKRTWVAQYRIGNKQRRVTLGSLGKLDPDQARKAARAVLARVELGHDPQGEKIESRAQAAQTLGTIVDRYLSFAKGRLRPRSYEEVERHFAQHWAPLKGLTVSRITRANIATRISAIAEQRGRFAANRARASLSTLFTWAMREGLIEANPVIGTNKATEERSRDRVLSNSELVEIWNACRGDDYGRIVRLLILTGQRRDEVGSISSSEINLSNQQWSLPGERTKNRLPHDVPLSDAAINVLRSAPRREGRELIFGEGSGGFGGWSRAKEAIDKRINDARVEHVGKHVEQVAPWRIHDIRRTVATGMADIGAQPHVIEAVLNHVSGHKAGVAGIYNRAIYAAEKRAALERWADHVLSLVQGACLFAMRCSYTRVYHFDLFCMR
jgi:integrase